MRARGRAVALATAWLLLCHALPARGLDLQGVGAFSWIMAKRLIGAAGSFALHEACHLALGAALGASISTRDPKSFGFAPTLIFGGLTRQEGMFVAMAGNACTAGLAEVIVRTRVHRQSDLAWGAAAFSAFNTFGYAGASDGDAGWYRRSGGNMTAWRALLYSHSSRVALALALDTGPGGWGLGNRIMAEYLQPNPIGGIARFELPQSIRPPLKLRFRPREPARWRAR